MSQSHTTMEVGVWVCAGCSRPVTARQPVEYTMRRAILIAERGLCVCRMPQPAGPVVGAPRHTDGAAAGPPVGAPPAAAGPTEAPGEPTASA